VQSHPNPNHSDEQNGENGECDESRHKSIDFESVKIVN
jgi:hypothetical protein